jgi:hypothetical protein
LLQRVAEFAGGRYRELVHVATDPFKIDTVEQASCREAKRSDGAVDPLKPQQIY